MINNEARVAQKSAKPTLCPLLLMFAVQKRCGCFSGSKALAFSSFFLFLDKLTLQLMKLNLVLVLLGH